MSDTQTYCFGRFLIDLPKAAEINGQRYEYMFGHIETGRTPPKQNIHQHGFVEMMKAREDALRKIKEDDGHSLKEVRQTATKNARIFKTGEMVFNDLNHGFEAYRWDNEVLFSMLKTSIRKDKIDSVLQRLETRLLPNLRARRPDEIPSEPGFCIKEGFIADDGSTPQHEYAELHFRFKQWPDVSASVLVHANGEKLGEPLLARMDKPFPSEFAEAAKQIKTIRKGSRQADGFVGDEVLEIYPTGDGYGVHQFVWESPGAPKWALFSPHIHIELETGNGRSSVNRRYMRPSLTDKQAIELFDRIVNSIRLRPTTPGKSGDAGGPNSSGPATPKRLPLGTKVSSLRSCPETGVYECPADAPGVTDRRVYLERSRPMPGAFVIAPKRGIAGFFGGRESKEVETTWTLVAYEQKA